MSQQTIALGPFGHHPEPDFDFAIEAEALEGLAYEVGVGLASQWPFWSRLSRALRLGRAADWFTRPDLEAFLDGLGASLCGEGKPNER